jgi:hypothetical protein
MLGGRSSGVWQLDSERGAPEGLVAERLHLSQTWIGNGNDGKNSLYSAS